MPSYEKSSEKITVSFSGNLNSTVCVNFEDELFEQLDESNAQVVFDLKKVDNISSMFLRICTKVVQRSGKEKLSIVNTPQQPLKVFRLTKLDSLLNISE